MTILAPTTSGTFDANGELLLFDVRGLGASALQLSGTFSATVQFEGSLDGATFVSVNMKPTNSATAASSATGAGVWLANITGFKLLRARVSAYTSGSASATFMGASTGGSR
tara:strand:- start:28401 stop:28733 length:333 start_codon:yes stop_codon:yes gene_type:complete